MRHQALQSRSRITALGLAVTLGSACGPAARPVASTDESAPLCRFDGRWTTGALRATVGGAPFVSFSDGEAEASLDRSQGALRLIARVEVNGWRLEGWSDPASDGHLRARTPLWLHAGVALAAGAGLAVRDARPGEVLVGSEPAANERFRFSGPVERWVPCEALGLAFEYRDEGSEARDRLALGFQADSPEARLDAASSIAFSEEPGSPPFLEVLPGEYPLRVAVLERRGDLARVLYQEWTGLVIVGWVSAASIGEDEGDGTAVSNLLGALAGPRPLIVCTSPELLFVTVAAGESPPERVGSIAPGTRFLRIGDAAAGEAVQVAPHPDSRLWLEGDDVRLLARPSAPLSCAEESFDPMAALRSALAAPEALFVIRAEVTASEGLTDVAPGSTCEVTVEQWTVDDHDSCRAVVRCGERELYGDSPTNGFLVTCDVDAGAAPPIVTGADDHPTAPSGGDGVVHVDTRAGTVQVGDGPSGRLGTFNVEARVISVERRPPAP